MIGDNNKNGYILLILRILLSILSHFLPDKKIMSANTSVRSATFDPNKVPSHNSGAHSSTELIEINVSGKMEIIATTTNPTIYLEI